MVGFFVNTLVIRGDLSGDPDVLEFLDWDTRPLCSTPMTTKMGPFIASWTLLQPQRDLARHPLFQHAIVLQNASRRSLSSCPALSVRRRLSRSGQAWTCGSSGRGRPGAVGGPTFDSALFDAATVERMAGHLQVLLAGIVEDPGPACVAPAAAGRGGAPPGAGGVERHGLPVSLPV